MPKKSRQTTQKALLEKGLSIFDSFFTAEDLHSKVKGSSIGIATVYRFLRELKIKNILHSYICDRRYVYSKSKSNHCHFICQKCGKIIHIGVDSIDFLKKNIKGDICHFQIDVEGICSDCKNKGKIRKIKNSATTQNPYGTNCRFASTFKIQQGNKQESGLKKSGKICKNKRP